MFEPFNIEETRSYMDLVSSLGVLENPIQAKRIHVRGFRFYYHTQDDSAQFGISRLYKSATTVCKFIPSELKKGLHTWRAKMGEEAADSYSEDRALYGTLLHIIFAEYLRRVQAHGYEEAQIYTEEAYTAMKEYAAGLDLGRQWVNQNWLQLRKDLISIIMWSKIVDFQPLLIEKTLFNKHLFYASTVDIVGRATIGERYGAKAKKAHELKDPKNAKRENVIVDLKSGRGTTIHEDYKVQLLLGKKAFEDTFPDMEIGRMFKLSPADWSKTPDYHFTEVKPGKWESDIFPLLQLAESTLGDAEMWPYMTALETATDDDGFKLDWAGTQLRKKTVREAIESYEVGSPDGKLKDSARLAAENNVATFLNDSYSDYFKPLA